MNRRHAQEEERCGQGLDQQAIRGIYHTAIYGIDISLANDNRKFMFRSDGTEAWRRIKPIMDKSVRNCWKNSQPAKCREDKNSYCRPKRYVLHSHHLKSKGISIYNRGEDRGNSSLNGQIAEL